MIGVDTNVLVRYFAADDAVQTPVARRFIETRPAGETIRVGLVVLAELIWVVRAQYGADRDEVISIVDELLTDPRFELQDEAAVSVAASDFETSAADFADLLIAATHTLHGCTATVTFDRAAGRIGGMRLLS